MNLPNLCVLTGEVHWHSLKAAVSMFSDTLTQEVLQLIVMWTSLEYILLFDSTSCLTHIELNPKIYSPLFAAVLLLLWPIYIL